MFNVICGEIASIFLFFYAISRFSKIISRCHIHSVKRFFSKITNNPLKSFAVGAFVSALMQSNKAVSSIVLTLVDVGVVNAIASLPILFGTPIGSSSIAFLVSVKIESIDEILIIAGAVIRKTKYKNLGHIIFYLGLMLFSLETMLKATNSFAEFEEFRKLFLITNNIVILYIIGIIISFIFQSSALIVSILTIFVISESLSMHSAVAMAIGATVGSTWSLIIITISMGRKAKKACCIYSILIFICSIFSLFFTEMFTSIGIGIGGGIGFAVSNLVLRIMISVCGLMVFLLFFRKRSLKKV